MNISADDIQVLFKDDSILAVNKPSGMIVHRGWGRDRVTMMHLAKKIAGCYVYPIHRLDRGTSGVLLFGLGKEAASYVQKAFQESRVEKRYIALASRKIEKIGASERPLSRRPGGPPMPAITLFRPICQLEPDMTLLELLPLTGRLHQIRRHLYHLGHPIIGDKKYGFRKFNKWASEQSGLSRIALHARSVTFPHPLDGTPQTCVAPLPDDLLEPLSKLGVPSEILESLRGETPPEPWPELEHWKERLRQLEAEQREKRGKFSPDGEGEEERVPPDGEGEEKRVSPGKGEADNHSDTE